MKFTRRNTYGTLQITRAVAQDIASTRQAVETAPGLIERLAQLVPSSLLRRHRARPERHPLAA